MSIKKHPNPNIQKQRKRYMILDKVARALLPNDPKPTESKILTLFTTALYIETPTPEKLPDEKVREIVRQVLVDLLKEIDA